MRCPAVDSWRLVALADPGAVNTLMTNVMFLSRSLTDWPPAGSRQSCASHASAALLLTPTNSHQSQVLNKRREGRTAMNRSPSSQVALDKVDEENFSTALALINFLQTALLQFLASGWESDPYCDILPDTRFSYTLNMICFFYMVEDRGKRREEWGVLKSIM